MAQLLAAEQHYNLRVCVLITTA